MTETASHLLELVDLTRQFVRRGTPFDAVSHVDLTIDAGEFVAIVGRSGNGKSTLINMVAGLVRPSSGTVHVDGREVTELSDKELSLLRNRTIGFVTQSQTLLGNLTVLDNVILPATMFPDALPFMEAENKDDAAAQKQNNTAETVPGIESEADNDPHPMKTVLSLPPSRIRLCRMSSRRLQMLTVNRQTQLQASPTYLPSAPSICSPSSVSPIWQTAIRANYPAVRCGVSPSPEP